MSLWARGVGSGSWKHAVSFKPDCKHSSVKRSPSTKIKSGSRPSRTRRACFRRSLEGLVMTMSFSIFHITFVIHYWKRPAPAMTNDKCNMENGKFFPSLTGSEGRHFKCHLSLASINNREWRVESGESGIGDQGSKKIVFDLCDSPLPTPHSLPSMVFHLFMRLGGAYE